MKIKEVCERTGLTDRAIRLYMENGLVKPKEEWNYTGRRAISFNEEDVKTLENVATLRRADFSISDIAKMKERPECIPDIVIHHKKKMEMDIESKKRILSTLDRCDCNDVKDYSEIADAIRDSASQNFIPKEDSGMDLKYVKRIIRGRISSLIALVLLVVGVIGVCVLAVKTAFGDVSVQPGGGYYIEYQFTASRLIEHFLLLTAVFFAIFAIVALLIYLAGGKKWWMLVCGTLCLLTIILLIVLPSADAERVYFFEFLSYRNVLVNTILYSANKTPEFLIKTIKFIPFIVTTVLCAVGYYTEKDIDKDV